MSIAVVAREQKGKAIAEKTDQIRQIDEFHFEVKSQSGNGSYKVHFSTLYGYACSCPDFEYRSVHAGGDLLRCKHIVAIQVREQLREKVREHVVIQPVEITACLYCQSKDLKRFGVRHNKYGDIQRFLCAECNKTFSVNLGFERMKHNPQAVTTAMQLYFSGESLRNTARSLTILGLIVSHKTVFYLIKRYTTLMEKYLDKITPQVGDVWRADELYLKMRGDTKYLYALMDDETRFWIAKEVANTKFSADIRMLFKDGVQIAEKKPKVLITDGAGNFHEAYLKELWTPRYTRTKHLQDIRMDSTVHNNKMERMNGEIRDREKVMRSLKKPETPILTGMQIFHNYVRPHMALKGKTPAEKAGIKIEGENKWLTMIQNASKKNHVYS